VPLILLTVLAFVIVGLRSREFGARQNAMVVAIAVMLVTIQFFFARYL